MALISFIVTNDNTICAFANGRAFQPIAKDHPNYDAVRDAICKDDVELLAKLTDIPKAVERFTAGDVEIRDGVVFYDGHALDNGLTQRILTLMREKFPFEPMLLFLKNLMDNPSKKAVDELYDFLAHQALPITDDGCFLGYKRVRDNYFDIYTGKIDNHVGETPEMKRNQVDDNREVGCSDGLHVGAINYVRGYSGSGCENGGHVMIVKVNPKDVVSVPKDSNCEKLRACRYEVIDEYKGDLIDAPVYKSSGKPASPQDWDEEEEDDEYEDEYEDDDDGDEDDDWNDDNEDDDDSDEDDDCFAGFAGFGSGVSFPPDEEPLPETNPGDEPPSASPDQPRDFDDHSQWPIGGN